MLRIKPVQPKNAPKTIGAVYKDIERVFDLDTVPLVFQYVANYERYFLFLWDRMKRNLTSPGFEDSCGEIQDFATFAIREIGAPSPFLHSFVSQIHPLERQQITKTVIMLERINAALTLLLIELRESLKSIFIGTPLLTRQTQPMHMENFSEFIQNELGVTIKESQENTPQEASKMLVPLFGANSIVVSHYPTFFSWIALEMENLTNTEDYLRARVELERICLDHITHFVQPLGISYKEFLNLTKGGQYIDDLLYILTGLFPSQFPHLVFTSALMRAALEAQQAPGNSLTLKN